MSDTRDRRYAIYAHKRSATTKHVLTITDDALRDAMDARDDTAGTGPFKAMEHALLCERQIAVEGLEPGPYVVVEYRHDGDMVPNVWLYRAHRSAWGLHNIDGEELVAEVGDRSPA